MKKERGGRRSLASNYTSKPNGYLQSETGVGAGGVRPWLHHLAEARVKTPMPFQGLYQLTEDFKQNQAWEASELPFHSARPTSSRSQ